MADVAADGQAEESVVSTYNPTGASPVLIVCEHASNHIPESFHDLGLTDDVAVSHVAWDPGAGQVAKYLADLVDAPCLLSGVSRLVYDCNRADGAPDAFGRQPRRELSKLYVRQPFHQTVTGPGGSDQT